MTTADVKSGVRQILANIARGVATIALTLSICSIFVSLAGQSPLVAGEALVRGAMGSPSRWAESLSKTIPLVMTGLGVAVSFRAGFWNIGGEGQFVMGALVATWLATKVLCPWPIVVLGGAIGGGAWSVLAGWLKVRRGAPEIISTIMLNYVALQLLTFAVQGPLQESAHAQPQSDVFPLRAQIPTLWPDSDLHDGIFIAIFAAGACWWLLFRTERGFLWRASGANALAARGMGIAPDTMALQAVALGGALCGMGGALEIAGATKQLGATAFGYGYTAIAVALLAGLHPLKILGTALLFGLLNAGGGGMERMANVPAVTVSIVIGVVLLAIGARPQRHRD